MTDEELLEIIDFNCRRDYSLSQRPEILEEKEAREEEEALKSAQLEAQGGISGEEAAEIARDLLGTVFGVSPEGMEENCYLDEDYFDVPVYCVNYSIPSQCYYTFSIYAANGELAQLSQSIPGSSDDGPVTEEEGAAQMEENCQAAREFMEEKLGIREQYEHIYCLYQVKDGNMFTHSMVYYFIRADGTGHRVIYSFDSNMLGEYKQTTYEDYLEKSTASSENYREEYRHEVKRFILE